MRRVLVVLVVGGLALAVAWWAWRSLAPVPGPGMVATVLGMTNVASGMRLATLRIVNEGRFKIMLLPTYALQTREDLWRTNQVPTNAQFGGTNLMDVLPFHPQVKQLRPGEFCELTVALPFDGRGWRASFWGVETEPPLRAAVRFWSKRIGLPVSERGQILTYTDWKE